MERAQSLPSGAGKVIYSSRSSHRPCGMIALALNNDIMFKMENSSFSGLRLLKRPSWPIILLEVMLLSIVCATARGCAGVRDLCCHLRMC